MPIHIGFSNSIQFSENIALYKALNHKTFHKLVLLNYTIYDEYVNLRQLITILNFFTTKSIHVVSKLYAELNKSNVALISQANQKTWHLYINSNL